MTNKFISNNEGLADADSADDAVTSTRLLEQKILAYEDQLNALPADVNAVEKGDIQIKMGAALADLERGEEAFAVAREAFDSLVKAEEWEEAVHACKIMFLADQELSLAALGQGVWLSVTFPINPELTVAMLEHIVDETPEESDGAAIAAAVAHYIADSRAEGKVHEELTFFTNNLFATVARRHSGVNSQEKFSFWVDKLELNDPEKFLPRLRNVVDVMVQDDWWVDREAIWAKLPH
ncbi:MAG: hypothetical protein GXP19_01430 [Gammaproteobacteria bacterium]|nr:hypothetical protein [Gammaproteobacteria bacterium]